MRSLNEFLAADGDDRPVTMVDVLAWDASISSRLMTGREKDEIVALYGEDKDPPLIAVHRAILVRCLCDNDGKRFSGDIIEKLLNKSSVGLDQLLKALNEANGLSPEAEKTATEKK